MWSRSFRSFGGSPITVRWLLGFALVLLGCNAVYADIQTAKGRHTPKDAQLQEQPPNGVEQSVQLGSSGQAEIILEAHGAEGKIIDFLLRDKPTHGRLTAIHPLTRNTASVTYARNPGDDGESDAFTFAVQARGTVVSAPATVSIEIPAPAPRLVTTPSELDFGAVNVGEASRARITLENQGGGIAIGQLLAPPPWEVEDDGNYRLAKGEKKVFQLVFRPGADRAFDDEIVMGRNVDQRARLVGVGVMVAPKENPADKAASLAAAEAAVIHVGDNPPAPNVPVPLPSNRVATTASHAAPSVNSPPRGIDYSQMAKAESAGSNTGAPRAGNSAPVILNDVGVEKIRWRWNDTKNIKVSWTTPQPPPKSYRIELRYLSLDNDQILQVNWRAYAQVDIHVGRGETEAILHGLPSGTRQTMRVVALDNLGHLAAPSEILQVDLPRGFYWGPTTKRVLFVALAICLVLLWRKRRNEMYEVEEVEELPVPSLRH